MKKLNYITGWLAIGMALALVGALAPTEAGAIANPRKVVWTIGDKSVKVLKDGTLQQAKPQEHTKDTSQSAVEASSTVINTSSYQTFASSGGVVTLTTTPSISTTTAAGVALTTGKILILQGTSDANSVTLQDDDTLAGSQVELGASTRELGANDVLVLIWDAAASTSGRWLEVSYSNLD